MKNKQILLAYLILIYVGFSGAHAQDTIRYWDKNYFMQEADTFYRPEKYVQEIHIYAFTRLIVKYILSEPKNIYGVAFTYIDAYNEPIPKNTIVNPSLYVNKYDSTPMSPSARKSFYESCEREVKLLNRVRGSDSSTLRKDEVFCYEFNYPSPSNRVVFCTEYYFDTPTYVADTFYVGAIPSNHYDVGIDYEFKARLYGAFVKGTEEPCYILRDPLVMFDSIEYPELGARYGEAVGLQKQELYYNTSIFGPQPKLLDSNFVGWGGIFPIVGLRCTPVRGLTKTSQGKGWAWLRWRQFADEGTSYEVRLWQYDDTTSADTLVVWDTLVTTTDTAQLFEGLALGGKYTCRIRKSCRYATPGYDTTVHSEWSEPVSFAIDTYDWEGIDEVPQLSFVLSPNPSRGVVELCFMQRQADGGRVEVSDMHGRTVHAEPLPAGADALRLDLSRLPAGAYLVKVLTPAGLAARRLLLR